MYSKWFVAEFLFIAVVYRLIVNTEIFKDKFDSWSMLVFSLSITDKYRYLFDSLFIFCVMI